jgi:ATP synthase protein I
VSESPARPALSPPPAPEVATGVAAGRPAEPSIPAGDSPPPVPPADGAAATAATPPAESAGSAGPAGPAPALFAVGVVERGWVARVTVLPAVGLGVVVAALSGILAGWAGVAGAALGTAVVVAFFGLDLLALRLARSRIPDAPIVLAVFGYVFKLIGLLVLLLALGDATWLEPLAFGAAAVTGTISWLVGHIRLVGKLVAVPPGTPGTAGESAPADLEATP